LGGSTVAGGKMKEAGTANWVYNANAEASNSSGFTALPGGFRFVDGTFQTGSGGYGGFWWSASESSTANAWYGILSWASGELTTTQNYGKKGGFSVRCLRD
jgi:uncharacterized protein (TIGR02145 family)